LILLAPHVFVFGERSELGPREAGTVLLLTLRAQRKKAAAEIF